MTTRATTRQDSRARELAQLQAQRARDEAQRLLAYLADPDSWQLVAVPVKRPADRSYDLGVVFTNPWRAADDPPLLLVECRPGETIWRWTTCSGWLLTRQGVAVMRDRGRPVTAQQVVDAGWWGD